MRWVGHVAHMEKVNAYTVLVGKHEGMKPRWEDNIKMDLKGKVWVGFTWLRKVKSDKVL
jgi:hypothetical protein